MQKRQLFFKSEWEIFIVYFCGWFVMYQCSTFTFHLSGFFLKIKLLHFCFILKGVFTFYLNLCHAFILILSSLIPFLWPKVKTWKDWLSLVLWSLVMNQSMSYFLLQELYLFFILKLCILLPNFIIIKIIDQNLWPELCFIR